MFANGPLFWSRPSSRWQPPVYPWPLSSSWSREQHCCAAGKHPGDFLERSPRLGTPRKLFEDVVIGERLRPTIAVLDEQPVGTRLGSSAAIGTAGADQDPTSLQLGPFEGELDLSGPIVGLGLTQRLPGPSVPDHHRSASVFSGRNQSLEVAIVERMVFDLDGQPLLRRVEAWSLRNRPTLECTSHFEPEIVMQMAGVMLLHHKLKGRRRFLRSRRDVPLRLRRAFEVPFLPVFSQAHLSPCPSAFEIFDPHEVDSSSCRMRAI